MRAKVKVRGIHQQNHSSEQPRLTSGVPVHAEQQVKGMLDPPV